MKSCQQIFCLRNRDSADYDHPGGQSAGGRRVGSRAARKPPTTQGLQNELNDLFAAASEQGRRFVDVASDDLASRTITHPSNHTIRTCLWLMRKNVKSPSRMFLVVARERAKPGDQLTVRLS